MKFTVLFSALLFATVTAEFSLRRGGQISANFTCEKKGSAGQTQCDATKDDDGKNCVWCSVSSLGTCVSQAQAEIMEKTIPSVTCDSDAGDDDAKQDDDSNPSNDDNTDYWKCLKGGGKDEKSCESSGCTWCVSRIIFSLLTKRAQPYGRK